MNIPKVSVIIPTYNRGGLIGRAIRSVLPQTFRDYEIIVIDDGSTDDTMDVLKEFAGRIRCVTQKNQGSAAARNRGIREAQGAYIAFLDSDDFWTEEKLAEQVKVLDAHPTVGIVYSRMPILNDRGEQIGMKPAGISGRNYKELLEVWGDLPTSTVMTRKECFQKAGLFDTSLATMQDIDMWLRIARHYELFEIEGKVLAYYSRHEKQITSNPVKVYEGLIALFKKILHTYEDVPWNLYVKKIAMNQYTLSRIYFSRGRLDKAWENLTAALAARPLVGTLFIEKNDGPARQALKIIKPWGYLLICFTRMTFARLTGKVLPEIGVQK